MSIFQVQLTGIVPINLKVTASTVTSIVDATSATNPYYVPWFQVTENAGATPNLTIDLYDGTTTYYVGNTTGTMTSWRAKAVTANQSILFEQGLIVPAGWKLRITSSDAAGKFDVIGISTTAR